MNCKPGDLAIVVHDDLGLHLGKVVECVRWDMELGVPAWFTRPWLLDPDGTLRTPADSCLRPIRDNDRQDETLTWAGRPEKVTA